MILEQVRNFGIMSIAGKLIFTTVTTPLKKGTLGKVVGNTITYTPPKDYIGADSFTFKVTDTSKGISTPATVSINVSTGAVLPAPDVTATPSDKKVTLNWSPVTGATDYKVCVTTTSIKTTDCAAYGGTWAPWAGTGTPISLPILNLENDKLYYFRVIAKDKSGNESPMSTEVTATPKVTAPLPNPSLSITFTEPALTALGAAGSGYEYITGNNGHPAVKFNGGSILVPNRAELQFTEGATFDMWVRLDSNAGMNGWGYNVTASGWAMALMAKSHDRVGVVLDLTGQDTNYSGTGFGFSTFATFDQSWACGTSSKVINRNPGIPVGEWFRVTATASPTAGTNTYVNKQLVFSCPDTRPNFEATNTQDMYLVELTH
jgi:hypothetical protein